MSHSVCASGSSFVSPAEELHSRHVFSFYSILALYSSCKSLHTVSFRIDTHDVSVRWPDFTLALTLSSHFNTYTWVFPSWISIASWVKSAYAWHDITFLVYNCVCVCVCMHSRLTMPWAPAGTGSTSSPWSSSVPFLSSTWCWEFSLGKLNLFSINYSVRFLWHTDDHNILCWYEYILFMLHLQVNIKII